MKLNNIKVYLSAAAFALAVGTTSCVGDLDVDPINPQQTMTLDQDALLNKIYASFCLTGQTGPSGNGDVPGDEGQSEFYRMSWYMNEFTTDEAHWVWISDAGVPDLLHNNYGASNAFSSGLYYRLYFTITLCNFFLEQTTDDDPETAMQRAEVRYIRAYNYYYIMDLYGNAAFMTTVSSELAPRYERKQFFEFVESELLEIEPLLANPGQNTYGRADKAAAWMLLSRLYLNAPVYLAKSDAECKSYMDKAVLYSDSVINSSYELASKFQYLFMGDNDKLSAVNDAYKEIILPIAQDGQHIRSYGGSTFLIAATHTSEMASWGTTDSWKCIRTRKQLVQLFFPDLKRNYEIKSFSDDPATTDFKEGDSNESENYNKTKEDKIK